MRRLMGAAFTTLVLTAACAEANGRAVAAPRYAAPSVVFVALGDSSTTCPDAPSPTTQSYPALLARHLPKGARYRNLAINHDDTDLVGVIGTQLPVALHVRPTLVVIWVVFHDLLPEATSPTVYRRELDQLLAPLQRIHAHVFIANVPDMRTFPAPYLPNPTARRQYVQRGRAFNLAIAAVAARRGAIVVDMDAATRRVFSARYLVPPYGRFNARGCAAAASTFYSVMHSHGAL